MLDGFGDQREQKAAVKNFERCVRSGGLLLIDHRNYDNIMDTGATPAKSIYYNVSIVASEMELEIRFLAKKKEKNVFRLARAKCQRIV